MTETSDLILRLIPFVVMGLILVVILRRRYKDRG